MKKIIIIAVVLVALSLESCASCYRKKQRWQNRIIHTEKQHNIHEQQKPLV